MPTRNVVVPDAVYQLKITLAGTRPPIWRRVLTPADLTLAQLHDVMQAAMGWEDDHLHEFSIGRQRYGVPDLEDGFMGGTVCINEGKVRLSDVLGQVKAKAEYTYDFGDGWEHLILVEKILTPEAGVTYPRCIDGKLHCPPGDCGGIGGFYNLLEAIRDPSHDEHDGMLEWIGGSFDPEAFSVEDVNQRLRRKFRVRRKAAVKRVARASKPVLSAAPDTATLMSLLLANRGLPSPERKRIGPDETVSLELNARERELILEHTYAEDDLTGRLRIVPDRGKSRAYRFTLGDLDDLAGHVAAAANHATNKKLRKELDGLFDRINKVLESYTDED